MTVTAQVDLPVDFNTMDETGLPWTFLDEAADPTVVSEGAHLIAGSGGVRAVVVVVDVTDEGIVHLCAVPGSVADNAHLLDTRSVFVAASERLPEFLPDPAEKGVTGRAETARPNPETPENTGRNGIRRHPPGPGSSNS